MINQTAIQPNVLLTDEHMRHFIVNGFVSVKTNLPLGLHETIYRKANDIFGDADEMAASHHLNPLNNILPMVPELQSVLDAPEVVGALTSLLGNNYVLHAHRHCHPNFPVEPKDEGQGLLMRIHKDGHAGGKRPRHRLPRWLILFYFPQDCPTEQGPTCVIPGNQYLRHYSTDQMDTGGIIPTIQEDGTRGLPEGFYNQTLMPRAGEVGTIWLLHFDIEHSVFLNYLDKARYGMKFVFMRTEEPQEPSWDNQAADWQPPALNYVPHNQEIVHTYVWNWLRGNPDRFVNGYKAQEGDVERLSVELASGDIRERATAASKLGLMRDPSAIPSLVAALQDEHEPVRVNAVYALGAIGAPAIDALLNEMDAGKEAFEKEMILHVSEAAYVLAALGKPAVSALKALLTDDRIHMRGAATFALGDMGPIAQDAVDVLVSMLDTEEHLMQRHVITALGLIKQPAELIVPALAKILDQGNAEIGHISAQALTRIGPDAEEAIPSLTRALHNKGAYARAWSTEALARIGTPEALRGLTHFIQTARWFPYVQTKNVFYSVDTSEKPIDQSNPEEALPALLSDWLKGVGMGAPDSITAVRENEENVFALETSSGQKVFAEMSAEKVDFYRPGRGEEGVGGYR